MLLKKKRPQKNKINQEYEELGKTLVNLFEMGYVNRKQMYKMSFVKGVVGGLGGVLGATILVALLLWVVSLFDRVPLLNRFIDTNKIQNTVQTPTK